jgi:hypothetical protein
MKSRRKPSPTAFQIFEFPHRHPENFLRVESDGERVRIRAARDNFTARDKTFFVRHLANEGFIADRFGRFCEECGGLSGIEWLVEVPPNTDSKNARCYRHGDGFMIRFLVYGVLLWLIELTFLVLKRG